MAGTQMQVASAQCGVDHRTDDSGTGRICELTLAHRGAATLDGRTLTCRLTGDQQLTNGGNATGSQAGEAVTAKTATWNATLAASAAISTGAHFTYGGTHAARNHFRGQRRHPRRRPPAVDRKDDRQRPKAQACPGGGAAPAFTCHRFRARSDTALAPGA